MKRNDSRDGDRLPPESALRTRRFFWLDWLRFGAALVVLVGHVRGGHFAAYGDLAPAYRTPVVAAAFALTRLGGEAVALFFVLSGFLVGGGSARKALDGTFDPSAYAVDRVTRIYTPLLPALLLTAGVVRFCGAHISVRSLAGNVVGLQGVWVENFGGNAPLWSLAYEIWFYLLWGGVLTLFSSTRIAARGWAWALVLMAFAVFTKLDATYLFSWLVGTLAYFSVARPLRWSGIMIALPLIVTGVVLSQLTTDSISLSLSRWHAWLPSHSVSILVLCLGFAVLVRSVAQWEPRSNLWKTLEGWGAPLAAFSYTLYLTHFAVLGVWERFASDRATVLDLSSLSWFVAKLAVCLIFAWGMYLLFERQTGVIRRWLNRRLAKIFPAAKP